MSELMAVYDICNQLINTSSRLEKESILRNNSDNILFREVLVFLFDKNIITGISSKKINKSVSTSYEYQDKEPYTLSKLLDYFEVHNTGSDADIAYVQFYRNKLALQEVEELYQEVIDFVSDIVTKSIRLGIDVTTINKIYGKNFIPTFDIMLGTSIENVKIPDGTYFYISQKLNGVRCFFYNGKLWSRQGKEFSGLEHIVADLSALDALYEKHYMYDGELILKDTSAGDSESFQIGTGIANSDYEDKSMLKLVIFDSISEEDFKYKKCEENYWLRKNLLDCYRDTIHSYNLNNIDVVPMFYEGTDQSQIWKWLDYAEANDMEGIMLNLNTPYEFKRTKNLIKVKKFYTLDLLVKGVEEGTGRNKGRLGNLVVDYKGYDVRVGSGFSDKDRIYYWEHPEFIVDKIVEVKYKERTTNKEGKESLQFPVFMQIRNDKTEVSYD